MGEIDNGEIDNGEIDNGEIDEVAAIDAAAAPMGDGGTGVSGDRPSVVARRPPAALVGAVVLGVVGAVLLRVSAGQDRLWWLVLWFVLGIVFLALPLLFLNDELATRLDARGHVPWWWWAIAGAIAAVGVGTLVLVTWQEGSAALATVAVVVTEVGMIGLHVAASRRDPAPNSDEAPVDQVDHHDQVDQAGSERAPAPTASGLGHLTLIGLVLIVVGVVVVAVADGFGLPSWAAVAVWVVGLVAVKIGVVPFLRSRAGRLAFAMFVLCVCAVAGLLLAYLGAVVPSQLLTLLGLSSVVVALSVLGLAAVHCRCGDAKAWALLVGGAATIVGGTIWVVTIANSVGVGIVVAAFVWGIGTWFVFRGEGIVLILLIGYLIVWGLVDRTSSDPAVLNAGADVKILAIGDSFISGEGARAFLADTNRVGDDRNECRRAATAYPYLVASELGYRLDFVACSGAKIDDLFRCGQMAPSEVRCRDDEASWDDVRGTPEDRPSGRRPQVVNFAPVDLQGFDAVLLSIGGNDVGFSSIVQACLLPRGCEEREDIWFANVDAQEDRLVDTYRRIRTAVGDAKPLIVMPYPMLVGPEACGAGLSGAEHEFVVEFITRLDGVIRSAATRAGVHYFEPSEGAFEGAQLCDDPPAANHLLLSPPAGDWSERYQPATWIHNSMHPNELGHRLIADRLEPFLSDLVAVGGNPDPLETPSADDELTPGERADAAEAAEVLSDDEWITAELYRTVRTLALPLALLLAAGMVFAAGLMRRSWWISGVLRPRDAV